LKHFAARWTISVAGSSTSPSRSVELWLDAKVDGSGCWVFIVMTVRLYDEFVSGDGAVTASRETDSKFSGLLQLEFLLTVALVLSNLSSGGAERKPRARCRPVSRTRRAVRKAAD
jgi:hypothetical protein